MRTPRLALLLVSIAIVAAAAFVGMRWLARAPADAAAITVLVPRGAGLGETARRLEAAGAIDSARLFRLAATIAGGDATIKAGEYAVPRGAGYAQLLEILRAGRVVQRFVVIPEGLPAVLVAERLAAAPLLVGAVPPVAEGSVLPDSYAYARGEPRAAVLARMQAAMRRTLGALWPRRSAATVVRTPDEAIILASIVEKETALAAEYRMVAGVYSNRLRIGMKLDADPTVIYPVTRGRALGRAIRRSELAAVNGYNTYAMPGLPTGPIANPGRAALAATLDPAPTRALYFVANGRGGHVFAATLAEHNANVMRWRAIRRSGG